MSSSPAQAEAIPQWDDTSDYARAIARTDKLISQGLSFSGHEPNCLFLNKTNGTFAAAAAVTGWDFDDDSRAIGLVDWDGDGDLDAWIANRTAPQLRFLRNDTAAGQSALMLLLEGKTHRPATGARVTLTLAGAPPLIRTVKCGEGFQGQSTRWLHFGLGKNPVIQKALITWPGGSTEEIPGLLPGGHYYIKQGTRTAVPRAQKTPIGPARATAPKDHGPAVLLTGGQLAPPIPALTYHGQPALFTDTEGPLLIHLWDITCADCLPELKNLAAARDSLTKAGLRVILISAASDDPTQTFLRQNAIPFPAFAATSETVHRLTNLHEQLFGTSLPLTNPSGLLLDGTGHAAAVYNGPCPIPRLLADLRSLATPWPARAALTLPFPGQWIDPPGPSNPLTIPGELAERGFLDESLTLFRRHHTLCAQQQGCAPVLMALAAAFEKKQRFASAIDTYRLARAADPAFPGAINNLAWHLAACPDPTQRHPAEALTLIREGVALTRRADPDLLDTLATAAAANQQWAEAETALTDAIAIARAANRPEAVQQFESALRALKASR